MISLKATFLLLFMFFGTHVSGSPQKVDTRSVFVPLQAFLRDRITADSTDARGVTSAEQAYRHRSIVRFYLRREFQPAWMSPGGASPLADSLIASIREASREGLRPDEYRLTKLEDALHDTSQRGNANDSVAFRRLADIDLLFTDSFMLYASHLFAGRVQSLDSLNEAWTKLRQLDLPLTLETALRTGRPDSTLKSLLPSHSSYSRLRDMLACYRAIAERGGWGTIPGGSPLARGSNGERVIVLRNRLAVTGDLAQEAVSDSFDAGVEQAVRRFQQRHGLDDDGVVATWTRAEMNVPVDERIHQIEINLERWRWLPRELPRRIVRVNIADYKLSAVENDSTVLEMRTVVGQLDKPTPVFGSMMTYLVINPSWDVPRTIAVREVIPLMLKDPLYLEKEGFMVFDGWRKRSPEIDPTTIDWAKVDTLTMAYHFHQRPGPRNPLGRLKFMFPNKHDVYLHDTPARSLFKERLRNFSHGCIRVQKPLELAQYVLQGDTVWTKVKLLAAIKKGVERMVHLPESIPVDILYETAWVDKDGVAQFRDDFYELDGRVYEALCADTSLL